MYSCRRPDRTPCLPGSPTPVLRRPPSPQVTLARSAVRRSAVPTPPSTHPTTIHPPDHCGQYRSWSGSKPSSFQPSPPPALTHLQLHPSDCRHIKAGHHHRASSSSNKRRRGEELMVQGWTPRGVGCCTRRTSAAASRSPKMCSRPPSAAALLCSGLLALVVCVHSSESFCSRICNVRVCNAFVLCNTCNGFRHHCVMLMFIQIRFSVFSVAGLFTLIIYIILYIHIVVGDFCDLFNLFNDRSVSHDVVSVTSSTQV